MGKKKGAQKKKIVLLNKMDADKNFEHYKHKKWKKKIRLCDYPTGTGSGTEPTMRQASTNPLW
jgi:hypothetical protein